MCCDELPESQSSTSSKRCTELQMLTDHTDNHDDDDTLETMYMSIYLTMVFRNQGLFVMEGTASSIRGCILMKFSVSSGNSLDTLYLSMDGEPAQVPGLQIEEGHKERQEDRR